MNSEQRDGTLGVIGVGAMGAPMAERVLAAGGRLVFTARDRAATSGLERAGGRWAETPAAVAAQAGVVLLMVPDLPQVEQLLAGPEGLLVDGRALVIAVGSTVSPLGVRALGERLESETQGRVKVVDCPVSGGVEGAAAGTLSIMMGGDEDAVSLVRELIAPMGRAVRLGPLGSGAVAKVCNQMIVGATVLAVGEAAVMAERSGLDLKALLDLLGGGYAGSRILETRAQRFVEHDHTPSGAAKYMTKDLGFAAALAEGTGVRAVALPAVRAAFEEIVDRGLGDQDLAVVQRLIEER